MTATTAQNGPDSRPTRLSIEPHLVGARNVSLEVTQEILKRCSSTVTVTDNRQAAVYSLRTAPGSSTLYRQNGDVARVFRARWKTSTLAKEVCAFVVASKR